MANRIALISNIHLSRARRYFHANWDILLEELAAEALDLILISGDLALDGPHREDDLAFARAQLDRLPAPWHAVPGNHDIGNARPDLRGEAVVTEARREAWTHYFGPAWWSLDVDGWRVVGLDSLVCGSGFPAETEQAAFLHGAFAGAEGRPVALLFHKPLCDQSMLEPAMSQSFWYPAARALVADALQQGAVRLVISGHLHEARDRMIEGIRHLWVPGTAFVQDMAVEWVPDRGGRRRIGFMMLELGTTTRAFLREPSRMFNTDIGNWLRDGIGHYAVIAGPAPYLGLTTAPFIAEAA
jgi:3',5'-cyclic AMP phosphodiesterase CpdA